MTGIRIEDPGDVRDGLHEALSADGPAVVDVLTDPNALSMPPKITGEQVKGVCSCLRGYQQTSSNIRASLYQ
jgi:pyruvate dehydrogenase (quinone)